MIALVPQATRLLDTLSVHAESVNAVGQQLIANISALRDQIQVARDQSNLVSNSHTFFLMEPMSSVINNSCRLKWE